MPAPGQQTDKCAIAFMLAIFYHRTAGRQVQRHLNAYLPVGMPMSWLDKVPGFFRHKYPDNPRAQRQAPPIKGERNRFATGPLAFAHPGRYVWGAFQFTGKREPMSGLYRATSGTPTQQVGVYPRADAKIPRGLKCTHMSAAS